MSLAPLWNLLKKKRSFDRHAPEIPVLVQACCDYIEQRGLVTEGIFRVSARKDEIVKLRKRFDSGRSDLKDVDPYVVACVLKAFFLEAEQPLLTFELYPAFLQAAAIDDTADQLRCLRSVVGQIPPGSKKMVTRLMKLLKAIAAPENSKISKMTASNLAIVFAPGLLRKKKQDLAEMLSDSPTCNRVVELLIRHSEELFGEKRLERADSSIDVNDPTVKTFYQTLRLGTIKITKARLLEDYIQAESEEAEPAGASPRLAREDSQRTPRKEHPRPKVLVTTFSGQPEDDAVSDSEVSHSDDLVAHDAAQSHPPAGRKLSAAEELANSLDEATTSSSGDRALVSDDSGGSSADGEEALRVVVDPVVAKHLDLLDYLSAETLGNLAATISSVQASDAADAPGVVVHEVDFSPLVDPARMRTPEPSSPVMSTPLSKAASSSSSSAVAATAASVSPSASGPGADGGSGRPATPSSPTGRYSRRKQGLDDLIHTAQHALSSRPSTPSSSAHLAASPSSGPGDTSPPRSPQRSPQRSPLTHRATLRRDTPFLAGDGDALHVSPKDAAAPVSPRGVETAAAAAADAHVRLSPAGAPDAGVEASNGVAEEAGEDHALPDGLPRSGSMVFTPAPDPEDEAASLVIDDENASELLQNLEAALLFMPESSSAPNNVEPPLEAVQQFVAKTSRLDRLKRRQSFGQALSLLSSLQHNLEADLEADEDFAAEWQRRLAFRNSSNSIRFPGDPNDTSSFSSQATGSAQSNIFEGIVD